MVSNKYKYTWIQKCMQQKRLVTSEFLQQVLIRKHCVTCVILLNIGMSVNKAKPVTTT